MEVQLAVYDLSRGMAAAMSQAILGQRIEGIWHTGIVVFGQEYYFGGGIQSAPTGTFQVQNNLNPVEMRTLGTTNKSQSELLSFLSSIRHRYTQETYDLITNNCNNFSDEISRFLLDGVGIPDHIVNLPRIVFSTPGGAMLRPMIENMQNSIRQQASTGLDPFANGLSQADILQQRLIETATSIANNQHSINVSRRTAKLDEKPIISADSSTSATLGEKLLNLVGPDGVKGTALNDEEKETIRVILSKMNDNNSRTRFTGGEFNLLRKVLSSLNAGRLSCLFLLRIMLLRNNDISNSEVNNSISQIVSDLIMILSQGNDAIGSVASYVMSLCCIANLLSHSNGFNILFPTNTNTDMGTQVIDIVMNGMSHPRSEIKQMSSTIIYNLVLYFTNGEGNLLSNQWAIPIGTNPELHPSAVQIICGIVEGITEEKDIQTRYRRLAIICRVIRSYCNNLSTSELIKSLFSDLGFTDILNILNHDGEIQPRISEDEKIVLDEILSTLQS
eukprot:gene4309-6106_t